MHHPCLALTVAIIEPSRKPNSGSLITRFFGRQAEIRVLREQAENVAEVPAAVLDAQQSVALEGLVSPCPFIRPLEHKLVARCEPKPKALMQRASVSSAGGGNVTIAIARKRGEANKMLTGRASRVEQPSMFEIGTVPNLDGVSSIAFHESNVSAHLRLQRDYVAALAGPDAHAVKEWKFYVECYSEVSTY